MTLENLGWTPRFAAYFADYYTQGLHPGRVTFEGRSNYRVITEDGEMPAFVSGRLMHTADGREDYPVVGDWTAVDVQGEMAVIRAILPRASVFARKEAGERTRVQPIAANIDTVFIAVGLDGNYSLRRVERYLALAWESGALPVVLLTKADLCPDTDARVREVERVAPGVPVHAVSTFAGSGLSAMDAYLTCGQTVALLGSSGVGKSTLINYLLGGSVQQVNAVREGDSKGRHTTTNRQIFITPAGALVVDTPGMRELQLWNASDGLGETFCDIEEISVDCRYDDCRHEGEPGCAVQRALDEGLLDPSRLENYHRMLRELQHLAVKQSKSAASAERAKWKAIHKEARRFKKG